MRAQIERLEQRALLTAQWTTVDDLAPVPSGTTPAAVDMASDASGGVYAVSYVNGDSATRFGLVRYKAPLTSQWQTLVTGQGLWFGEVAVALTGEVYISGGDGTSQIIWTGTLNADRTALSLSEVDRQSGFNENDLAVDANGNVFVVCAVVLKGGGPLGTWHWIVRKQTAGQGSFVTVDDFTFNRVDARPNAITVVPSGAGAGVYVVGNGGGGYSGDVGLQWVVRKSTNGGSSWTTVDSFAAEPSTSAPSSASAVVADDNGVVHVAGRVSTRVISGGTKKNPTYRYDHTWYLRSSADGSTWDTGEKVFPENVVSGGARVNAPSEPAAVATDQTGNVYVAGTANDPQTNAPHSVVRTNAGGGWSTSDDFSNAGDGAVASGMTRDASGSIYVGGRTRTSWFVRSMTPALATIQSSQTFSTAMIAWPETADVTSTRVSDELLA